MSALHAIAGHAGASSCGESRVRKAETQDVSPPRPAAQDACAQATFSPQGLKALEHAVLDIADTATDWVHDIGEAGTHLVAAAADAIDDVGTEVAGAITASADALVKGVGAARAGVNAVEKAASDAVSDATGRVGAALESAAGYVTLAALAGGALLDELV